jgi:general secretion pathway protein E
VTGPTGSGKTTTLYASLNYIKSPELKIITTEDPVEYQLRGIDQIQVNPKVGLTFAAALRSILRQDPDIIMVGEIRDLETAEIAIQSSLTGHLVLSTLHTNDAPTAITRLVEMGIAPYLAAPTLAGAMAQRLLRRLCNNCKKQGKDGKWQAVGCDLCDGSGYKGRLGIFELLINTPTIQTLIQQGASAADIGAQAQKEGMRTLLQDGLAKAAKGLTTEEEVYRLAQDN